MVSQRLGNGHERNTEILSNVFQPNSHTQIIPRFEAEKKLGFREDAIAVVVKRHRFLLAIATTPSGVIPSTALPRRSSWRLPGDVPCSPSLPPDRCVNNSQGRG